MDFLTKLEGHVVSIDTFHQSEMYQNFVARWNLNVYFQIRFREIATPVEESCLDIMDKVSSTPETTASCFDETPNGLQKFTESKTQTCCAEENINVGKRNEGSLDDYDGNFCQDHDNYRLVPLLSLL